MGLFKKLERALGGGSRRVFPPMFRRMHVGARQLFVCVEQRIDPVDGLVQPVRDEIKKRGKFLPVGLIGRVEVVKGAAPIEYGTNAVAGVAALETRRGSDAGTGLTAFAEGGSEGYRNADRKSVV